MATTAATTTTTTAGASFRRDKMRAVVLIGLIVSAVDRFCLLHKKKNARQELVRALPPRHPLSTHHQGCSTVTGTVAVLTSVLVVDPRMSSAILPRPCLATTMPAASNALARAATT